MLSRMLRTAALAVSLYCGIASASSEIGRVAHLSGMGEAGVVRGLSYTVLAENAPIFPEDRITTDRNVSVELVLGPKDTALLIKPGSDLVIRSKGGKDWLVDLKRGALLSEVRNPQSRPRHFFVKVSSAVMGVRGTTFFIQSEPGRPEFFCPCHGKIEMKSPDGASTVQFVSKHHDTPKLISRGSGALKPRLLVPPPGYDPGHSDSEIARLKKLLSE